MAEVQDKERGRVFKIDSAEAMSRHYGQESHHPLVAVLDASNAPEDAFAGDMTFEYDVYALFLKQTYCGDMTYGRKPYDYQEGTVTSFAPGQVVHVRRNGQPKPMALGLVFHPDLVYGTPLGRKMRHYSFFSYSSHEALHLSEEEKTQFKASLAAIEAEALRPNDRHTRRNLCREIEHLLDLCLNFYQRQFDTRREESVDVLERFERELDSFFARSDHEESGLPSVKFFAERCFLSPNYFGDLVKKETGRTPQELIQRRIVAVAKDALLGTNRTASEIAYSLGFLYPQHFNRFFKRRVGMTPVEFRRSV